jgi:hypothetical protein
MSSSGDHNPTPSQPVAKEDVEMGGVCFTQYKKPHELTAGMRQLVLSQNPKLYPRAMSFGEGLAELLVEDVFALRGDDIPIDLPRLVRNGERRECVLGLQQPDPTCDSEVTEADDELQNLPQPIFIGASIKPAEERPESQKRDNQGQKKGKNKKGKQTQAPQQPSSSKPSPAKDCVKVAFHLDSQNPHIAITTRKLGGAKGQSDLLTLRLFAQDLELDSQKHLYTDVQPTGTHATPLWSDTKWSEDSSNDTVGNVEAAELNDMRDANKLIKVTFAVKPGPRNWSGLTTTELASIHSRTRELSKKEMTLTRDLTVQHFDKARFVNLFFPLYGEDDRKEWAKVEAYTKIVFTLAKQHGNFWFYRAQLELNGVSSDDIEKARLPYIDFVVPRWMVTLWVLEGHRSENGSIVWTKATPRTWKYHMIHDQYKNPDEAAFLIKLGIQGEQTRQNRDLNELVQNKNGNIFRGFWLEMQEKGRYIVQVFMADNGELEDRNIKMPGVDTRVVLWVDPTSPQHPDPTRLRSFKGLVVEDIFQHGASFCCLVWGSQLNPQKFTMGLEHPIRIEYTVDNAPHEREMVAIEQLQRIKSTRKPTGVDLKALFLGCTEPAPDTAYVAKRMTQSQHMILSDFLRERGSNKTQSEAVTATVTSPTGVTVIQGPPGTGKTDTSTCIITLHNSLGHKVLCTAPQNEAVKNLHEHFVKNMESGRNPKLDPLSYVLFTGAFRTIQGTNRLKKAQELAAADPQASKEDIDNTMDAGNIITQYTRMSQTTRSFPGYQHTFGAKLRQMIEHWASPQYAEVAGPWVDMSRDYLNYEKRVGTTYDWEQKKALLAQLGALEDNLGHYYLKHCVKIVFVTASTSAHETLVGSFEPVEILFDESALESLAGLAVPAAAYKGSVKHITFSGDHKQGKPIYIASDSNLGHGALSRNLFAQFVADPEHKHPVFILGECYRMVPDLLKAVQGFYPKDALKPCSGAASIDKLLQNTVNLFVREVARSSFLGNGAQFCINVSGPENAHQQVTNSTTKCNPGEAQRCAELAKALRDFSKTVSKNPNTREITADDIKFVTPYSGQVSELRKALFQVGLDDMGDIWTTAHSQGRQGMIIIFSPVINIGKSRPTTEDKVPMSFMADKHNILVSLSRARVCRMVVGDLSLFAQMALDRHPHASRFKDFFSLVKNLTDEDQILTEAEWDFWLLNKTRPVFQKDGIGAGREFKRMLVVDRALKTVKNTGSKTVAPKLDLPPVPQPTDKTASAFHNIDTTQKTTGSSSRSQALTGPDGLTFAGDRYKSGQLRQEDQGPPAKKRKNDGEDKKKDDESGDTMETE